MFITACQTAYRAQVPLNWRNLEGMNNFSCEDSLNAVVTWYSGLVFLINTEGHALALSMLNWEQIETGNRFEYRGLYHIWKQNSTSLGNGLQDDLKEARDVRR